MGVFPNIRCCASARQFQGAQSTSLQGIMLCRYASNIIFNIANKNSLTAFPCPWFISTLQLGEPLPVSTAWPAAEWRLQLLRNCKSHWQTSTQPGRGTAPDSFRPLPQQQAVVAALPAAACCCPLADARCLLTLCACKACSTAVDLDAPFWVRGAQEGSVRASLPLLPAVCTGFCWLCLSRAVSSVSDALLGLTPSLCGSQAPCPCPLQLSPACT